MAFNWGYDDNDGPDRWGDYLKIARHPIKGQSPIDLELGTATKANWRRLRFRYKRDRCTRLHNNGHTFVLDCMPPGDHTNILDYNLRRGPLGLDRYHLVQIHFHWGASNEEGSEHTVSGQAFPAEAHLVHFNMKYGSFDEAKDKEDGLCVLGVLFRVGEPNKGVQQLVDQFGQIPYKGNSVPLDNPFYPKWLLPRVLLRQKFWHYQGSLTTPPLYESVNWVVFQKSLEISEEQLEAFRNLKHYCPHCSKPSGCHEGRIARNFRPVQPRDFHRDEDDEDVERPLYSFRRRRRFFKYVKEEGDSESSSSSDSSSDESDEEAEEEDDSD